MNGLTFLNAPLLWGLTLAAVPIIIHLLYRRRFRRIDWAPMRYLKLSVQRNRRRIRLEQLLLLLLRTLAVLALFLIVARPVVQAGGLAAWLGGGSGTSQLVLVDDSLSMGYRDGSRSSLERARELTLQLVEKLGPKDRLTLLRSSQATQPLLREVELLDRSLAAELIRGLRPSDVYTSWPATLDSIHALITTGTYPIREVTIVTDLRRAGWDEKVADVARSWAADSIKLRIFDVGSTRTENTSVAALEPLDRAALVGTPTRWLARIHNGLTTPLEGLQATLIVDGQPSVVPLPQLAPGATTRIPLSAVWQTPGEHHLAFRLADDPLPADNQRWAVVNVREHLDLVLVDGEPSSEPLMGEVDFLGVALSAGQEDADTWRIEVKTDAEWAAAPTGQPDLLVLANVPSLTAARAKELERLVKRGMGLMIFLGDQVDTDNYNRLLYRDGRGLLPAALDTVIDDEINGLVVEEQPDSPLAALGQLKPAALEKIRFHKRMQVDLPDPPSASRVLARLNNASSSPAVLDKQLGAGRVVLWTLTADKGWSDWPTESSYVLAVREAAAASARSVSGERELTAGQPLRYPLPLGVEASNPVVEVPGQKLPQALRLEQPANRGDAEPRLTLAFSDSSVAGLYKMSWQQAPVGNRHALLAINPDVRESALERIPAAELRALFGSLQPEVIAVSADKDAVLKLHGQEIWRSLATFLMGLLVVETCFATWVGRSR